MSADNDNDEEVWSALARRGAWVIAAVCSAIIWFGIGWYLRTLL